MMKVSEITNEELAKTIEEGCGSSMMGHAIREAARRLRQVTVSTDNSKVIAELQRRLKVADDALDEMIFNLDAWVHGGRFAPTESDDEALEKAKKARTEIRQEIS